MLVNPNGWSCLPTAICHVTYITLKDLFKAIGHDGSDRPYPPPYELARRGFHTQECVDALDKFGFSATPIEVNPMIMPCLGGPVIEVFEQHMKRFHTILKESKGFICGSMVRGEQIIGHAVSNLHGQIIDPRSSRRNYYYLAQELQDNNFEPIVYYRVDRKCT